MKMNEFCSSAERLGRFAQNTDASERRPYHKSFCWAAQVQEGAKKERSVLRIVRGLVRLRRADRSAVHSAVQQNLRENLGANQRREVERVRQPPVTISEGFSLPPV